MANNSNTTKGQLQLILEHIRDILLPTKADLVDGKVADNQIPDSAHDVFEYNDPDDFPEIGEVGKIYVSIGNSNIYVYNEEKDDYQFSSGSSGSVTIDNTDGDEKPVSVEITISSMDSSPLTYNGPIGVSNDSYPDYPDNPNILAVGSKQVIDKAGKTRLNTGDKFILYKYDGTIRCIYKCYEDGSYTEYDVSDCIFEGTGYTWTPDHDLYLVADKSQTFTLFGGGPWAITSATLSVIKGGSYQTLSGNVQADWDEEDPTSDAYILNKPDIPDVADKADKVSGATAGNLASLDANGNLTDSGVSAEDIPQDLSQIPFKDQYEEISGDWEFTGDLSFDGREAFQDHGVGPNFYGTPYCYNSLVVNNGDLTVEDGDIKLNNGVLLLNENSGNSYQLDTNGDANLASITVGDLAVTSVTLTEYNGQLDINDNDIVNVRNITGYNDIGLNSDVTISGNLDMQDNNISNVGNLSATSISMDTLDIYNLDTTIINNTGGSNLDINSNVNIYSGYGLDVDIINVETIQNGASDITISCDTVIMPNAECINLDISGDTTISGDLAVTGTIIDGSGNSLVYDNDSRLTDAREPLSHEHTVSDITDFPSYGTESGTICEGDDSRLSDDRFPSNNSSLLHTSGNEGYISGTKYFINGNITVGVREFSTDFNYYVGDYVIYQGNLYRCTTAHYKTAWNSGHFTSCTNTIASNNVIGSDEIFVNILDSYEDSITVNKDINFSNNHNIKINDISILGNDITNQVVFTDIKTSGTDNIGNIYCDIYTGNKVKQYPNLVTICGVFEGKSDGLTGILIDNLPKAIVPQCFAVVYYFNDYVQEEFAQVYIGNSSNYNDKSVLKLINFSEDIGDCTFYLNITYYTA